MNIKEIFDKAESGTLTFAQFEELSKADGAKFTDLSEGKYVSKAKYDDDIVSKDNSIAQLNDTIKQRDKDLSELQTKLNDAGTDATKLSELQTSFDSLQTKYAEATKAYQQQLEDQKYKFAVKEYANSLEFTSQAAKRDFIRAMNEEKLKMKGDALIGADDFKSVWSADNVDAFPVKQEAQPAETSNQGASAPKPQFVGTTPGAAPQKQPSLSEMMRAANEQSGASNF